jgi:hypothetical protein
MSYKSDINSYKGQLNNIIQARPMYDIPESQNDYLALEKAGLDESLPGYSQVKNDIQSSTAQKQANINETSNSVNSTLTGTTGIYGDQMNNVINLDIAAEKFKLGQRQRYSDALLKNADYQDKSWNWNKGQKYGEQYNYFQSLIAGADAEKNQTQQNFFSLLGSGIQAGSSIVKSEMMKENTSKPSSGGSKSSADPSGLPDFSSGSSASEMNFNA